MNLILDKEKVLANVRIFRERHIGEYKEQFKGWQEAMQQHGDELKDWAAGPAQDGANRPKEPPRPQNHLKQYDDLIHKLEWHVSPTIEIDEYEFDKLVNDNFGWTSHWKISNAVYASGTLSGDRIASGNIRMDALDMHGSLGSNRALVSEDHVEIE